MDVFYPFESHGRIDISGSTIRLHNIPFHHDVTGIDNLKFIYSRSVTIGITEYTEENLTLFEKVLHTLQGLYHIRLKINPVLNNLLMQYDTITVETLEKCQKKQHDFIDRVMGIIALHPSIYALSCNAIKTVHLHLIPQSITHFSTDEGVRSANEVADLLANFDVVKAWGYHLDMSTFSIKDKYTEDKSLWFELFQGKNIGKPTIILPAGLKRFYSDTVEGIDIPPSVQYLSIRGPIKLDLPSQLVYLRNYDIDIDSINMTHFPLLEYMEGMGNIKNAEKHEKELAWIKYPKISY
jgi:hypothetical protein